MIEGYMKYDEGDKVEDMYDEMNKNDIEPEYTLSELLNLYD